MSPRASAEDARWARLARTADCVRAATSQADQVPATGGRNHTTLRRAAIAVTALAAAALTAVLAQHAASVHADSTADQDLFSLTNQDRASNGLHALLWHSTLSAIGENKPYGCSGITVDGRSYDMIQRNYFAHLIPTCNQYVFSMMTAFGINYRSAGENIGWDSGTGDAASSASYINQQFMNSTEHRDNILNTAYTHLGTGSDYTTGSWTGAGSAISNVWMFSEEFAQLATSAPPPPPPSTPKPTPRPTAVPPPSNNQPPPPTAAATPAPTPVATVIPTATPEPTPIPTATPIAAPLLGAPQPPLLWTGGGLIADSIESVLEAFLVD